MVRKSETAFAFFILSTIVSTIFTQCNTVIQRNLLVWSERERRLLQSVYDKHDPDYVDQYLQGRRRLEIVLESMNVSSHRPWQAVHEVDGLRIEEIATFVTSTGAKDQSLLWERIIPSARTWMRYFVHKFVVVEDTLLLRFALRQCAVHETTHYTYFECRHEATYILSRRCNDEPYGADGPCCKVDEAFNFLTNDQPDLFASIKYVVHADDDLYWRVDQLMRFMATLEPLNEIPIIGNWKLNNANMKGVWHIIGCQDISTNGWYQPMLLNRAALQLLRIPSAAYGLAATCSHFEVTHDVGMGVLAWLLQFYHVQIPRVELNIHHEGDHIFQPDLLAVHCLKAEGDEKCENGHVKDWPEPFRYKQHILVGCGDIDTDAPFHNSSKMANMYDAFRYFRSHGRPVQIGVVGKNQFVLMRVVYHPTSNNTTSANNNHGRKVMKIITGRETFDEGSDGKKWHGMPVEKLVTPRLIFPTGYLNTEHSKKYNITKEWHEFTLKDCNPPGSVAKENRS